MERGCRFASQAEPGVSGRHRQQGTDFHDACGTGRAELFTQTLHDLWSPSCRSKAHASFAGRDLADDELFCGSASIHFFFIRRDRKSAGADLAAVWLQLIWRMGPTLPHVSFHIEKANLMHHYVDQAQTLGSLYGVALEVVRHC